MAGGALSRVGFWAGGQHGAAGILGGGRVAALEGLFGPARPWFQASRSGSCSSRQRWAACW